MPKPGNGWHRKNTNTPEHRARRKRHTSPEYRRAKEAARRDVEAGRGYCWRPTCGKWIPPGSAWHLGHDDHDHDVIRGPEHASCNLKAAARAGAAARNHTQRGRTSTLKW